MSWYDTVSIVRGEGNRAHSRLLRAHAFFKRNQSRFEQEEQERLRLKEEYEQKQARASNIARLKSLYARQEETTAKRDRAAYLSNVERASRELRTTMPEGTIITESMINKQISSGFTYARVTTEQAQEKAIIKQREDALKAIYEKEEGRRKVNEGLPDDRKLPLFSQQPLHIKKRIIQAYIMSVNSQALYVRAVTEEDWEEIMAMDAELERYQDETDEMQAGTWIDPNAPERPVIPWREADIGIGQEFGLWSQEKMERFWKGGDIAGGMVGITDIPTMQEAQREGILGDPQKREAIWNSLKEMGVKSYAQASKFGATVLPHQIANFMDIIVPFSLNEKAKFRLGTEFADKVREYANRNAKSINTNYQEWLDAHPEIRNVPEEWKLSAIEAVKANPELLADPAYWMFIASDSILYSAVAMTAALGTTILTGNPIAGLAASTIMLTPLEGSNMYDAMVDNGAAPSLAASFAIPAGVAAAAVENIGELPVLASVSQPFKRLLMGEIRKEIAERTVKVAIKSGLKTFTHVQIGEIMEEVIQGSIEHVVVKLTTGENTKYIADLPETALRTAMTSTMLGGAGGIATGVGEMKGEPATPIEPTTSIKPEAAPVEEVKPEVTPPIIPPAEVQTTPEPEVSPEPTVSPIVETPDLSKYKKSTLKNISDARATKLISEGWIHNKKTDTWYKPKAEKVAKKPALISPAVKTEAVKPTEQAVKGEIEPTVETAKEPWQLTKAEYLNKTDNFPEIPERTKLLVKGDMAEFEEAIGGFHKQAVEQAIKANKPVPAEVLAEYPDLQKAKPETISLAEMETGTPTEFPETTAMAGDWDTTIEEYMASKAEVTGAEVKVKKLRSDIWSLAKAKGFSAAQARNLFTDVTKDEKGRGKRHLHLMTSAELTKVMAKIKKARPVEIKSKKVLTEKTEKKIQGLKTFLAAKGQMDETGYKHIMSNLGYKIDKFVDAENFITEGEGKLLIRSMNDEADVIGDRIETERLLKEKPQFQRTYDKYNKIGTKEQAKMGKVTEFEDMRYYMEKLEQETGLPFLRRWNELNDQHYVARYLKVTLLEELRDSSSTANEIMGDEKALDRVQRHIASKNPRFNVTKPTDINADEIKFADTIERQLRNMENMVRIARFEDAYITYEGDVDKIVDLKIKDAPKADIRKAIDIYESQGREEVREYLNTKEWGIIKSGYDPWSVVNPKIFLYAPKAITMGKQNLHVRAETDYPIQDRNLVQRYSSYATRMYNLDMLAPSIRNLVNIYDEAVANNKIADPKDVSTVLGENISMLKGYRGNQGRVTRWIHQAYSVVMRAVFLDPYKWARNMLQNTVLHPDKIHLLDVRNKKLTSKEMHFIQLYVSQKLSMKHEYLMQNEKMPKGLNTLAKMADKINLYPMSDEVNRIISFWLRINKVHRSLDSYHKHGDIERLMNESGAADLESLQNRNLIELLMRDKVEYGAAGLGEVTGEEAFAMEMARQVTNNVHFMYEQSQKAPVHFEHQVLTNLLTFPRGVAQIFLKMGQRLNPKANYTTRERLRGAKQITEVIVMGELMGALFCKATGRDRNPYSLVNMLSWELGGLIVGAIQDTQSAFWDTTSAIVTKDKDALNRAIVAIPRLTEMTLPLYASLLETYESLSGTVNVDRYALRLIREALDKEYKTRGSAYKVNRTWLQKLQHAIFGGTAVEEKPKETTPSYRW